MKSKRLLSLMLLCFAVFGVARAQETLTVHDGTDNNSYVPVYGFYADAYLKSEMVYPAAELGDMDGGTITSMTFYASSPAADSWGSANFQVFLTEVADATISAFAGPGTIVYEGALDGTQSEMTITFTTPYVYNGGNLLVGVYNTVEGSYKSISWAGEAVTGASVQGYSYSSLDDVSATQRNFLPKTTFTFTPGEVTGCGKPRQLAVNYEGGNTATVTWTGDATSYNIDVNGTVTNNVTSPYTLTNLELATTYAVKVQANCDGDLSDFTNPVSFTTDACMPENMCEITYELADSYGDGWNGNTLSVVNVANGAVLATWTIPSGGSSANGTLALCDGIEIQFVWAGTSWPYENSFTVYDINDEIICQHIKDDVGPSVGVLSTYTVSCTVTSCRRPTDLAVSEIGSRTATLRWVENGEATAWQVEVTDLDGGQVTTWNANATSFEIVGLTPDTRYSVRVKPDCEEEKWSDAITFTTEVACPAPANVTVTPTPVSATVTWTGDASNYNLRYGTCAGADASLPATIIFHAGDVWGDGSGYQMLLDADHNAFGTTIPETGALSTNCSGNESIYAEFEYKIPANADGDCTTSNIVLDNTIYIQIPAGTYDWCITNPTPGDRIWIASNQGSVGGRADDYEFEGGMIYEFNLYMLGSNDATDVNIICNNVEWTTVNNVTSPYTINGLDPETEYTLEVQAVCGGEDGSSTWTSTSFTTPSNCDAPLALNVTNLMPTTATLNWTGYQDGFEVWYRPSAQGSVLLEDSFENGLGNWTTIDADGDGNNWDLMSSFGFTGTPRTGSDMVVSMSYYSGSVLYPDNYLVSPQVELGGSITFWACAQDAAWPGEHFGVAVSTTSNTDASTFTTIQEWTMTAKSAGKPAGECRTLPNRGSNMSSRSGNRDMGTWYQYTVDLGDYAGRTGYVALRHFDCSDMFYLDVDDITIYGPSIGEQPWIQLSSNETTIDITSLDPETTYEWQVRGVNSSCDGGYTEWSEMGNFTTPGLCDPFTTVTIDELTATSISLSWTGYQESYLVQYRTAEDITNITFEDTADEQGNWTTDNLVDYGEGTASGWDLISGYFTFLYTENPPQTLISPELTGIASNSTLAFDYVIYDAGYPETFRVGFSTTDNSVGSFTWGEEVTATDAQYFQTYMVEVPAGARYFAIQCTSYDAYALILDNFVIGQLTPAGEWNQIIVNESNVTINGLTPETLYQVYVQGICGEEEYTTAIGGYFTTPELTTIMQTTQLTTGTNWFSTYVEITLDDLKGALQTALGNVNATLKSKDANIRYTRGRWGATPANFVWDVAMMYMIEVGADCEFTLEGMPIDPAAHSIDVPGNGVATWIGFPFSGTMTLTDAFTGFATNGDAIKGKLGNNRYARNRWSNTGLTTLEPGQGYIYTSAEGSADRVLVYPSTNKATKNTVEFIMQRGKSFDNQVIVPNHNKRIIEKVTQQIINK